MPALAESAGCPLICIRPHVVLNTDMVEVVDFGVLRDDRGALHDADGFIVVPAHVREFEPDKLPSSNLLVTNLHLCPLTPNFGELIDGLEVDLGSLVKDLACAIKIGFGFSFCPALFVELRKVDV